MPIQWDQPSGLPPLKKEQPPVVNIDALLAVNDVHLPAADIPRGILRQFYESILGLQFLPPDPVQPPNFDAPIEFLHHRRRIILFRQPAATLEPSSATPPATSNTQTPTPPHSDFEFRPSFITHHSEFSIQHSPPPPAHVAFLIKDFSEVLQRLRSHAIPYDLLHIDHGLTRTALLHDPAGNFVHLVETRPL